MSKHTVFPNAPITEALLDIQVLLPKDTTLDILESIYDTVKSEFPQKEELLFIEGKINMKKQTMSAAEESTNTTVKTNGFRFRSLESNKLIQSRLDGFTFNKLKPYDNWELFVKEARSLWDSYKEVAKPEKVLRLGLRYINRIDIPLPFKNFSEYILNPPQLSPELPQSLSNFFTRVVVPFDEIQADAIITQTIQNPTEKQKLPFIFDIDVYKEIQHEINDDEIWDNFEKFRKIKNDIFFNSLTKKTKEMFK